MFIENTKSRPKAFILLESGEVFEGVAFGKVGHTTGELIFNTAMTGYQEVLTDPSYAGQCILFTYPHIGNVGVNSEDVESERIWASGCIIRELPSEFSNWRAKQSLKIYLKQHNIVGIARVDTRALTQLIRNRGNITAHIVSDAEYSPNAVKKGRKIISDFPSLQGADLAAQVSHKHAFDWDTKCCDLNPALAAQQNRTEKRYKVVLYDFGTKHNILRILADQGCSVTVVPAKTDCASVLAMEPDGIVLSNGPADPSACTYAIETTRKLLEENIPILGICLGCQLLALACGAKTYKMEFGHHGINHPVKDIKTGQVFITTQNHNFAIDSKTLPNTLTATHYSLLDHTLQGIAHNEALAMGFQGHPEASPGPQEATLLFDQFVGMMQTVKNKKRHLTDAKT